MVLSDTFLDVLLISLSFCIYLPPPISTPSSCFLLRSLVSCYSPPPRLFPYLAPSLSLKSPPFPFLWSDYLYPVIPLSVAPNSLILAISWQPCFCFTFLVSGVITGCVCTLEDPKLEASSEREHGTFVFLALSYSTQHDLFYFHPFTCKVHLSSIFFFFHLPGGNGKNEQSGESCVPETWG